MMASQTSIPDEKKMHVIIIGSGCTGLFIAQGLKKVRRRTKRRSLPSAETSSLPFP
jgi:NADH dehydrogenase FAD-containing subunit